MASTDKLKKLLREETPLPSDLSWETMQSSIIPSLDDSKRKKALYYRWIAALILLLIIGSITAYYITTDNSPATAQVSKNTGITQSRKDTNEERQNLQALSTVAPVDVKEIASKPQQQNEQVNSQLQSTVSLGREPVSPTSTTRAIETTTSIRSNTTSTIQVSTDRTLTTDHGSTGLYPPETATSEHVIAGQAVNSVPLPSTTRVGNSASTTERGRLAVEGLTTTLDLIEVQRAELAVVTKYIPLDIEPIVSALPKNSLALSLGSTLWTRNSNLNNYERSLAGTSATLQYGRRLSRKISLSTGLRYRSLNSRLDYYEQRDTLVEVDQYLVNTLTSQIDTIGVTTKAYQYREIRHLNQTALLSIPLMINYHGSLSRSLTWNAGIGVEYTLFARQTGRYLQTDLASDGFRSAQPLSEGPYDQLIGRLGIQVSAGLDYALSDNLSAMLRVGAMHAGNSWSSNTPSHPTIADISLGVRYAW